MQRIQASERSQHIMFPMMRNILRRTTGSSSAQAILPRRGSPSSHGEPCCKIGAEVRAKTHESATRQSPKDECSKRGTSTVLDKDAPCPCLAGQRTTGPANAVKARSPSLKPPRQHLKQNHGLSPACYACTIRMRKWSLGAISAGSASGKCAHSAENMSRDQLGNR